MVFSIGAASFSPFAVVHVRDVQRGSVVQKVKPAHILAFFLRASRLRNSMS